MFQLYIVPQPGEKIPTLTLNVPIAELLGTIQLAWNERAVFALKDTLSV